MQNAYFTAIVLTILINVANCCLMQPVDHLTYTLVDLPANADALQVDNDNNSLLRFV